MSKLTLLVYACNFWQIMSKDYQLKASINQKLIEMGERER